MIQEDPAIRRLDPQARFQQTRALGQGTTAQVLSALDSLSGRQVVLKLARDEQMARLFRGEVELQRRLSAPVFPELLDFRLDGQGVCLLVMERRPGLSLEQGVAAPSTPEGLARVLAQLAQGLAELVDLGHLHGDLSPGNVLLDGERVSLLDLGLARPLDGSPGDRSGTLATMAPERLRDGRLHAGGDIWSLGVLGWTLACGHAPFPEEPEACIRAVLDGRRASPGPAAAHPLMPLLEQCLDPDPDQRPGARDLLARLLEICGAGPELVPRRPAPGTAPEWCHALQQELVAGRSGILWGDGAGEAWSWLDWLVQESTLAGRRLLRLDLEQGTPLDWARRHLQLHPDLEHNPGLKTRLAGTAGLPGQRAERRRLFNSLLDLLPSLGAGRLDGLVVVYRPSGAEDEEWLQDWGHLLAERSLPWVLARPGALPDGSGPGSSFQLGLRLASPEHFRRQVAGLLPGLRLSEPLTLALESLSEGRLPRVLDTLRLNLARGTVSCMAGTLEPNGDLLSPEGARRLDPESLQPELRDLLAELTVWSARAGQALWFERRQQQEAGPALARLEAEALVRDRGDGVPTPVPGVGDRLQSRHLQQAHGHLFRWFRGRGETGIGLQLEHLAQCPADQVPREDLLAVAMASSGQGYPEARIRVLELALEVAQPVQVQPLLSLLVQALQETGQPEKAREALRRIFHLDPLSRNDRVQALIQLGYLYHSQGRSRLARRVYAAALAASDPRLPLERLKALTQLALSIWRLGRVGEARGLLEEGTALLTRFDPPWSRQLCYQANLLGALAFALGETERAGLLWQELLSNSGREADPGELVRARMNLALVHARDNRLEQADQELEKAAGQARELHFETALAEVLVNRAHLEFLQGRVEPAGQHLDQAARLCELTEERSLLLPVLYAGADLDYRRGRLDRAISGLQRLDEQGRLQNRPGARCEARALGLLIDSDLGLLPDLPDERAFIRDCLALDERELLLEWLLVAASLGRAPEDSTLAGLDSLGGSCPRRGLLELLGRGHSGPEEVLSALGQLPPGEWPLGDRLLLNLAEGQAPESCGSLVEHLLQTDRLSPFQQVHLGLLIGRAKLQQGRLAQAGEQLGQAVKVLRGLADSRVLKDTGRYREAPVTQALAQWAQRCQRMIRESPH